MVPNAATPPLPSGFNAKPSPFGVSFTGMACSEPRLIELAYAFEQARPSSTAVLQDPSGQPQPSDAPRSSVCSNNGWPLLCAAQCSQLNSAAPGL